MTFSSTNIIILCHPKNTSGGFGASFDRGVPQTACLWHFAGHLGQIIGKKRPRCDRENIRLRDGYLPQKPRKSVEDADTDMNYFAISENYDTFALLKTIHTSPDGGIGRRAGLKHQWSNPCRFDPGSGY